MTQTKKTPLVSILVPAYNADKTLETAIRSAVCDTYTNIEILIVDDNSTDNTPEVMSELQQCFRCIETFSFKKNKGAGAARDFLLQRAKGEYIAFLDSDDMWSNGKLRAQIEAATTHSADIVTSGYTIINENSDKIGTRRPPSQISGWQMYLSNWLPTSFTLVRSDLIGAKKMPHLRRRQDYAYWLTIFAQNKNIKSIGLPESYGTYLRQNKSLSSNKFKNIEANFEMFRFLGWSKLASVFLVLANVFFRVMRK